MTDTPTVEAADTSTGVAEMLREAAETISRQAAEIERLNRIIDQIDKQNKVNMDFGKQNRTGIESDAYPSTFEILCSHIRDLIEEARETTNDG